MLIRIIVDIGNKYFVLFLLIANNKIPRDRFFRLYYAIFYHYERNYKLCDEIVGIYSSFFY